MHHARPLLPVAIIVCLLASPLGCGDDDPVEPGSDGGCTMNVDSPAAHSIYDGGESITIRWRSGGGTGRVDIELVKDAAVVGTIAGGTSNDGFHDWTAEAFGAGSGDYTIRVTDAGDDGCSDESPVFTLRRLGDCTIDVGPVLLDDAEFLVAGSTLDITWQAQNSTGAVDILLGENVFEWSTFGIIADNAPDTGVYSWIVDSFNQGTDYAFYTIMILDAGGLECSGLSETFRILDNDICYYNVGRPSHGEQLVVGEVYALVFSDHNGGSGIDVDLYSGVMQVGRIASNHPASQPSLNWTVGTFGHTEPHDRYKIVVTDVDDPYCRGESQVFTIVDR